MTRKILILTFYYPPDLCAGSFRAGAFVDALIAAYGSDIEVEVLTTMPNRYQSYRRSADAITKSDRLSVFRFDVGTHRSGIIDQSRSFVRYARQVFLRTKKKKYDFVFATSSRLMTAALATLVARNKKALLYLDVRDLFVDTMNDMLGNKLRWALLPVVKMIERVTFQSADGINVVSPGFNSYFAQFRLRRSLTFFSNGIDQEFLDFDFSAIEPRNARRVILYAGNIGEGQGLDRLIPDAARLLSDRYCLVIVGDGGAREQLARSCSGLENVTIKSPVDREKLKSLYAQADYLLLHLNDYNAFEKVLPSKIFEYAATGKPVVAGVSGYAAQFIREEVENAAVFTPCDATGLQAALDQLDTSARPRLAFKRKYARSVIMRDFASDVMQVLHDSDSATKVIVAKR